MEERTALEGALLRMERLRQQKGQKEICYGICVPSYLSKIEHGSVCPDENILSALFARLGIRYEDDPVTLKEYQEKIEEYFYRLEYHLDKGAVYEELKSADETLRFSRYAIDWLLIRGFEGEPGTELLAVLKEQMSVRQLGWYYSLCYWEHPETQEGYEAAQRASEILGNACAMVSFCSACMLQGDYASIHRMENRVVAVAVEEGNTYSLASYFFMKGDAYACLNMEKMMMDCYERGLRLLQNTAWQDELQVIYYNIGATYISLKKYDLAVMWLDRALEGENPSRNERIAALHKKTLALARGGKRKEAREILETVGEELLKNGPCREVDYLKYREAMMECEEGFLDREEYQALLERLITTLKRDCHFGHLYFYRDVIVESYRRQRKYKCAMEFEQEISSKIVSDGF